MNPYAAPSDRPVAPAGTPAGPRPDEIRAAQQALDRHLADPEAVLHDRAAAGGRITRRTVIAGLVALVCIAATAACFAGVRDGQRVVMGFVGALLGTGALIASAVAGIYLVGDLLVVRRSQALTPETMVRSWIRALRHGRGGYLLACLAPSARQQSLEPPDLAPVRTGSGTFAADAPGLRQWARTFACHGFGQVRWLKLKRLTLVREEGDLAEVEMDLFVRSWPRWANVVSLLLFLFLHLIGLVLALVLFFALRKTVRRTVAKTLLRGRDGAWYLLRAELDDAG